MSFGAGLFGVGLFGADSAGTVPGGPDIVMPIAPLRVAVCVGEVVQLRSVVRVKVFGEVGLSASLRITMGRPRVLLTAQLSITVFEQYSPSVPITISVSSPFIAPVVGSVPYVWSARVMLGNVDVSTRLTGQVAVEAEEGAARVAHFSIVPIGAVVALSDLARMAVSISLERFDESGARTGLYRLFSGVVDSPDYNASTRVLSMTCSDSRQAKITAMTRLQIDALTPTAVWSPFVFDRYAEADQYAADRLSTTAGAVDGDAYGALAFTPWSGATSRTLTASEILDGTLQPRLAAAASARQTRLSITYRRPQAKVRGIAFRYAAPALATQLFMGIKALTRNAVEQAISGAGAALAGPISWVEYPTSTTVEGVGAVLANATDALALCLGGSAWLNRRYSRWVDETWTVHIGSEGTLSEETRVISVEWDASSNDTHRAPTHAVTAFSVMNKESPVPYIPPRHGIGETVVDYVPEGQPTDSDFVIAYRCAVLAAGRAVAESLRGSVVAFSVALDPSITLRTFLSVDTDTVSGEGKVTKISHRMDIDSGSAISDVELECVSATLPTVSAPVRAVVPNAIEPGSLHARADTWIGGLVESRPWDEATMFGFSTNAASAQTGTTRYPEQFSVHVPGIEEAAQGAVTAPPTCTMRAGSPVIEDLSSTDGFAYEVAISGVGIQVGTTVVSVNTTARSALLSKPVTLSGSEKELRLAVRQYIPRNRVNYMPNLTRRGPLVGA